MRILKKFILALLLVIITLGVTNSSKVTAYTYDNQESFEKALARLMNDSNIFTYSQNKKVLDDITAWTTFPDLSPNIRPFNSDGTPYEYYWFFQKAINYKVVEYDISWNKSIHKLIDDINSINPKATITVDQFNKLVSVISSNSPTEKSYVWNWLSSISVDSATWNAPFLAEFKWDSSLAWWGFVYEWDFWDGSKDYWKNVNYVYVIPWTYQVKLSVTDKNGDVWTSVKEIVVSWTGNCSVDTDWDSVNNCIDACPLVNWDVKNDWCPIFEISTPSTKNIWNECMYYNKKSVIFWHATCLTCPCENFLDFNADVRKCDFIIPALVSPDWKEIYSKWNYFQVFE